MNDRTVGRTRDRTLIYDLFNVPVLRPTAPPAHSRHAGPQEAGATPADGSSAGFQGAFVTTQSLSTFVGGSFVVGLLWRALGILDPDLTQSKGVAFGCAVAVGIALFYINDLDPQRGMLANRQRIISAIVAAINVIVLFLTAVGGMTVAKG
jgi:hypothetical protein